MSRKKLSDADFRRLFQANEILLFTLSFLDTIIRHATANTLSRGRYDLRNRLETIRTNFLTQLEKTERKLGDIDPAAAEHFSEFIGKKRRSCARVKENFPPHPL